MNPDLLSLIGCTGLARSALRRLAFERRRAGDGWRDVLRCARAAGAAAPSARWMRDTARQAEALGLTLVAFGDDGYPPLLGEIPDPPIGLFVAGRDENLFKAALAIVGARRCSAPGRSFAFSLARDLARAGVCVVSGLARGIDGAAHQGAIEAGGITVAVLGAGHDHIYPAQHRGLASEIAVRGALVSEYPPGTSPRKHHFPERNRIVSGLAHAIVLIEAGERSGSLITARLALEQGREVMAVPGAPETGRSRGCHRLIQAGAALVEDARDVLDVVGWTAASAAAEAPEGTDPTALGWIAPGEVTGVDAIVERSGWPVERVLEALATLELDGFVAPVDGGYIRVPR